VKILSPDLFKEDLPVDVHNVGDCIAKNCSKFIS
jgi:hypothetical protein